MSNKLFETEDLKGDLKSKAIRGGVVTTIAQIVKLGTQIVSNVVLARLLTPGDFGLVAMVSVVATFIVMFKDLGLSQATIQSDKITHKQVSSLFWINLVFGLVVMALTMAISIFIAEFYGRPELKNITIALSIGLFVGGATVQHQALLKRRMMYKSLAVTEIASMIFGVTVAIILAYLGFGYWSLIALQLAQALMTLTLVFFFTGWIPSLYLSFTDVRKMLAFGGYMTIYSFVNYFARNLDTILIGWKWGAVPVGLYSRAYSLLLLPIAQVTSPFSGVAVPTLSRLQDDPIKYNQYYFKMVRIIAFISMPLIIIMAMLSHDIVVVILGDGWSEAAGIFKILAFAAFWQPIASTVGWVYVSLGRVKRMMKWGFIGTSVMACFIILGLNDGAIGVAKYYSISMWMLILPIFFYAFSGTTLSVKELIQSIKLPFINSFIMGCCFYVAQRYIIIDNDLIRLLTVCAVGIILYLPIFIVMKPVREEFKSLYFAVYNRRKKEGGIE
ncbi:lipopolysaccharide biosynthesis protein [uncultured Vibrio sp.]|uniref:lipopolysaccharide biosynthesis protein n=1 Tax=uncultured Vibrio sp. TaxID=114054 RepID=UPI0025EB85AC|nr:lipopolysaccharide biosynthesis protein [uncultured Vibrio sp.]